MWRDCVIMLHASVPGVSVSPALIFCRVTRQKRGPSLALARSEGGALDETQVDALCARTAARMGAEEVSARSWSPCT